MLEVRFQAESTLQRLALLAMESGTAVEPFLAASRVVDRAIQKNFDYEGRDVFWPELSPAYRYWKFKHYPDKGLLELTGRLRNSITTHFGPATAVAPAAIVARTDVEYARAHQFGDHRIPPRPFLVLTVEDQEEMSRAIAESFSRLASRP